MLRMEVLYVKLCTRARMLFMYARYALRVGYVCMACALRTHNIHVRCVCILCMNILSICVMNFCGYDFCVYACYVC